MQSSIPSHKFLLDENVHRALYKFLKKNGWSVKLASKSISDTNLAAISKKESRILVTNDEDFSSYSKNDLFSVILLKVIQGDEKLLINSIEQLLKQFKNFSGRRILVKNNRWEDFPLTD